jgi:hypothetical protein
MGARMRHIEKGNEMFQFDDFVLLIVTLEFVQFFIQKSLFVLSDILLIESHSILKWNYPRFSHHENQFQNRDHYPPLGS